MGLCLFSQALFLGSLPFPDIVMEVENGPIAKETSLGDILFWTMIAGGRVYS